MGKRRKPAGNAGKGEFGRDSGLVEPTGFEPALVVGFHGRFPVFSDSGAALVRRKALGWWKPRIEGARRAPGLEKCGPLNRRKQVGRAAGRQRKRGSILMNQQLPKWLRDILSRPEMERLQIAIEMESGALMIRASVCRVCPQVSPQCPSRCVRAPRRAGPQGN